MINAAENFRLVKNLGGWLFQTIDGQDFDQDMNPRFRVVAKKIDCRGAGAQNSFRLKTIHGERSKSVGVLGGGLMDESESLRPPSAFESHQIGVGQSFRLAFGIG